jgi:hypothetical protein
MQKKKLIKTSLIAVGAVAVAGLAFAGPSIAATMSHANSNLSTAQTQGHGNGQGFGNDGKDGKDGPDGGPQGGQFAPNNEATQEITVDVPADGGTYKLLVTESAPAAATNNTNNNAAPKGFRNRTLVLDVTGSGSVKVSVPGLHPGSYKAELVKVSSSQDVTVAAATPAAK